MVRASQGITSLTQVADRIHDAFGLSGSCARRQHASCRRALGKLRTNGAASKPHDTQAMNRPLKRGKSITPAAIVQGDSMSEKKSIRRQEATAVVNAGSSNHF